MPLTRWQKFRITLKVRYKVRREIFTIGVPSVIAAIFLIWAFQSGFAPTANPNTGSVTSQQNAIRAAEIAALSGNSTNLLHLPPPPSNAPEEINLYLVVVAVPVIALMPYVIDYSREVRRKANHERDFADFLFELSELVRGGIDPSKAFLTLADGDVGSITPYVQSASKQMAVGYTFEQALHNLGEQLQSPLSKRYIDLVIQASYSGGSVSNLIQNAALDMGTFLTIEKEKKSGLSQYTVVLYMGQVILIVLAGIMVVQFIPQIVQITKIGAAGLSGFLGQSDIANVTIERNLFFLVYLNGLFGGLVIGKISEGKIKGGLKHSLVLMIIALLAWNFYVLPNSATGTQNVKLHVVSFDPTGIAGFPLKDQLVVNVSNSAGQAVPSAAVTFIATGGASATPEQAATDATGQASSKITLGPNAGVYIILITSGSAEATVSINATLPTGG